MSFSATDAAFEGFRLVRRHPLAIVFWALAYLVFFAIFFGLFGSSIAGIMAASETLQASGEPSRADLEALGQSYFGLLGLGLPLGLVLGGVLNAAVARAVLRPSESAFGYLRLGSDELRVIVVSVVLWLLTSAVLIVGVFALVAFGVFVQTSGQNALWLVVVLLGLALVGLMIWLSLRLSLAIPITVGERRIALFESFNLTRGRSLPLLGMAIIAGVMTILVSLLSTIIALPVTMATGGVESLAAYEGAPTLDILRAAAPAIGAWIVLNAVFSALQLAVMYAPFSAAYRDIKGA